MRTFEVFYNNGNRKFFEVDSMTELLQFLLAEGGSQYIYKIELRIGSIFGRRANAPLVREFSIIPYFRIFVKRFFVKKL